MNMVNKKVAVFFLILMSIGAYARKYDHTRYYVWDKRPIEITLPLNKTKMVMFDHNIKVIQAPSDVEIKKLQNVLYLKASDEFDEKDLYVNDIETDETVIVSLSAKASVNDIYSVSIKTSNTQGATKSQYTSEPRTNDSINYLSLTRYVIQKLYGNENDEHMLGGVMRVPMRTKRHVGLVYHNNVIASPIASWRGGELYVTAVQLNYIGETSLILDPRASLRGRWLTASFYPTNQLEAKGRKHSTTTAILTSSVPFNDALYSARGYVR